jgi:hypothetical protein
MTQYDSTIVRYVYKGHWEDGYSPVPTSCRLSTLVPDPTITVVGSPCYDPQQGHVISGQNGLGHAMSV